ncbi:tetratricopeptide repeat protein [Marivirga aurantiaca]|nr:tetratricopeptide repeat protein [Marivirga aurantiaca]
MDSLKNLLEVQLATSQFQSEEQVVQFLQLTGKLYLSSPSDALFYAIALENKLNIEGTEIGQAYIYSYKGNFYWAQGIYSNALKNYFMALELFEKRNDTMEVVQQLNNIGETYKKQKDFKKSSYFLKRALNLHQALNGLVQELILVNLGQLYMLEKRYDSANIYLNIVLNTPQINNKNALGFAHLYKGIVFRELHQYDSSFYHLHKSLGIWEEISFKRSIVESKAELGKLALLQQDFKSARQLLMTAEKEAAALNTQDLLMRVYQYQIDLNKLSGSKKTLINCYDKYISLKDSLYSTENRSEINSLSVEYEFSQKEKEYYKLALEQNILTNEIKTQSRFLLFSIIVILCAVIFILVLWNQRNRLKKTHDQLKVQKEKIEENQSEISRKSLELASLNKELYALNQTLEEKIVERSEQLSIKNKQIAKYTYFNSHKLRAPVASVLGLINVLELSKDGILDYTILAHLKTSAQELDLIIHRLKNILEAEIDDLKNN